MSLPGLGQSNAPSGSPIHRCHALLVTVCRSDRTWFREEKGMRPLALALTPALCCCSMFSKAELKGRQRLTHLMVRDSGDDS